MPSIKKLVAGFLRHFSALSETISERVEKNQARGGKKNNTGPKSISVHLPNATIHNLPESFLEKYLNG